MDISACKMISFISSVLLIRHNKSFPYSSDNVDTIQYRGDSVDTANTKAPAKWIHPYIETIM